jgi:DNA invertase Pin-like site-specific DNA recombinase
MILTVFAGIAEFERALINDRTSAGRAQAIARGVRFGRPAKISEEQWRHYHPQIRAGTLTVPQVAALVRCNRSTIYRRLERENASLAR